MSRNTNKNWEVCNVKETVCEPVCESLPPTVFEPKPAVDPHSRSEEPAAFAHAFGQIAQPAGATANPHSTPSGTYGHSADRDERGRFRRGNLARLIVGDRSAAFWQLADEDQRAIMRAVIEDAGHAESEAPKALTLAATSIAQAALIRDSAFARMIESGGALSSVGRARRSFLVWQAAVDRLERNLRLVGLRRMPKSTQSFAELLSKTERVGQKEG